MKFRSLFTIGLTALMVGGFCQSAPAVIISALTSANSLVTFDSATPGTILSNIAVSGLTAGDSLVGIDYRPLDGQFVGLGYNSGTGAARVYSINGGVFLGYRNLNSDKFIRVSMFDDGLHNDGTAGDNNFGAFIVINSALTQYYIYAENNDADDDCENESDHHCPL